MPVLDTLKRWGLNDSWVSLLAFCKWSSLQEPKSRVQVITSVPDGRCLSNRIYFGMQRLHAALKSMPKFPASKECPVDVQVWSLGGANDGWYADFARTFTQESFSELGHVVDWKSDHVRLIFQENGAGANWKREAEERYESESLIRCHLNLPEKGKPSTATKKLLWDETQSLLLNPKADARKTGWGWHSKIMLREYPVGFCKRAECRRVHGWRYFGSHNCSRASWGWSSSDGSSPPRNWEMGVILTSLPASSENGECGVDLRTAAPLPFRAQTLKRTYPWL